MTPLVTLGMPIYNEKQYLAETVENLLKQTYPAIEILMSDNASDDGTSEMCEAYAAKYPHITYVRHPKNLGQHGNFNWLAHHAKGTYFCWASGHDLLDPDFVAKSVEVLESDPSIVLAYPRTMNMTKEGSYTREKVRPFDITHMPPGDRFREVMWRVDCNYVYGTWRREEMIKTDIFQPIIAGDRVFLAEMAIKGIFAPVDTFKYYRMSREHVQTEMEKRHRIMQYFYPDRTFTDAELSGNRIHTPTIHAFHQAVTMAEFPFFTRIRLHLSIWLCGVMKFHLFPGADLLSLLVKKILPVTLLEKLLRKMQ